MESFRKLGINEALMKVLKDMHFTEPSEIQEKTIPLVVQGKDVIGGSATGSGKTLAFGAGILQNSERGKGIQALILTPTRELAEQIRKALHQFSKYNPLHIISVYGGVSINPQIHDLRSADVVVGTPGRILDHLQRDTIDLRGVKMLVLDEADRMLDMGFIDDVRRIISQCPRKRQTLLFSATISQEISRLASDYMNHPTEISAEQFVDPTKLKQTYYEVPRDMKFSILVHFLRQEKTGLVMVFCNTRHGVDLISKNLGIAGIEAEPIHGGLSQNRRSRTLEIFSGGKAHVLVCSDVAARGLDIKNVSHVYNYDIPKTSKEYIHRIGRTARAGEEGEAISILTEMDYDNMRAVLNDSQIKIKRVEVPQGVERIMIARHPRESRFHGRGDREERGGYRGRARGYAGGREGGHSGRSTGGGRGSYGRSGGSYGRSGGSYGRPREGGHYGARNEGHGSSEHPGYVKNTDGTYSKASSSHGEYRSHGSGEHRGGGYGGQRKRSSYRSSNSRPHSSRRY